ncbi:MAG: hypothetical protein KA138_00290 [Saprospiraceae bacterium]|nr:hypothetical protein [Saprospiraceae bacterium]
MKKLTFYFLFLSLSFFAKAENYGDIVKIKHVLTNTHLHSHAIHYGHPQSSGQQQVTAFGGADDNDYWVIKSEHGNNNRSGSVRHGDVIRLEHYLTRRNLHSHAGIPSPVTGQQEVTCFGENGNGDSNDNWRIEIDGGDTWAANRRIRLIHINTNHALHSHAGHAHPQWTAGQQEVTGFGGRDDNDWWVLTEIKPGGDPKNLAVILAEIWMGECGNANNCHHEPVAGLVICELVNTQSAESIPVNVGRSNQIWRAYDHTLVCDNYHAPREFDNGEGIGRQRLGTLQFPIEEALLNSGVYHLKARFNLGVRHQDYPLASVGGHWLARGDNLVEALIPMNAGTLSQGAIIGPFHTVSDRCHEFWLKFTFGVWDRD